MPADPSSPLDLSPNAALCCRPWDARIVVVSSESPDHWVYVVTDIEVDGPWPGPNSMRSFASVAVTLDGTEHGRFEAVLEELPGAAPNGLFADEGVADDAAGVGASVPG